MNKLKWTIGGGIQNAFKKLISISKYIICTVSAGSVVIYVCLTVYKATVTVVDIDSGAEEKIVTTSPGSATGLNLKEYQKIYFGGLPTIGNYRYIQWWKKYSDTLLK